MQSKQILNWTIPITKGSSSHLTINTTLRYSSNQRYVILNIKLVDPASGFKKRGLKVMYYSLDEWNIEDIVVDAILTTSNIQDGLQGDF